MDQGWVKIYRKLYDNPNASDPHWVALWVYFICRASRGDREVMWKGKKYALKPGQFTAGRKQISKDTGINESKITRLLKRFKIEQQIEQLSSSSTSLFTVIGWEPYQNVNSGRTANEQQSEQQTNSSNRPVGHCLSGLAGGRKKNRTANEQQSEQQTNTKQEVRSKRESKSPPKSPPNRPPTNEEWMSYATQIKYDADDAQSSFDHYTSNGWKVGGKATMKDWKAAARNCQRRIEKTKSKPVQREFLQSPQPKHPSTWEINTRLTAITNRIKQIKGMSPGDHCDLRDFASADEIKELADLSRKKRELEKQLTQL